jgi:hypothetical protein
VSDCPQLVPLAVRANLGRKPERFRRTRALWFCRVYDAKLVIARLDRLARSTAMIADLMKSGVDFVAADMPLANRFGLDQHERLRLLLVALVQNADVELTM